jgi:spore maturation protein CgeB
MRIFVFGSSITSSYWNGAATYYRGIYKNLATLGHEVTFAEPNIYDRQKNRDVSDVEYANVIVYETPRDIDDLLHIACTADLVVKHSGVGADDSLLERRVLDCKGEHTQIAFWDVDAPATLARVERDLQDPFRACIPKYDFIFTYGGGDAVVEHYLRLGAQNCHPIYNALDPETHHPAVPDDKLACDLVFVGNRLPDREKRVEQFLFRAAELAPKMKFILGGEGWGGKLMPANVRWIGHVGTGDHNKVNCSARMVLNINRESMAEVGYSPPTRVFEAAGAGACLITDDWKGVEAFFVPNKEILIAKNATDIVNCLHLVSAERAKGIGMQMRTRAMADHTYESRAHEVDAILRSSKADRHPSNIGEEDIAPMENIA